MQNLYSSKCTIMTQLSVQCLCVTNDTVEFVSGYKELQGKTSVRFVSSSLAVTVTTAKQSQCCDLLVLLFFFFFFSLFVQVCQSRSGSRETWPQHGQMLQEWKTHQTPRPLWESPQHIDKPGLGHSVLHVTVEALTKTIMGAICSLYRGEEVFHV